MAYDFDGSGSANLITSSSPITAIPLTMACWFNVDTDTAAHTLMCLGNTTNGEKFRLSASGDIAGDPVRFRAANAAGTNSQVDTSTGFTTGVWHHAACVASSASARAVYLNGGGKATTSGTTRTISAANRLVIGAQIDSGTLSIDTDGRIAGAAIWNVDLSDAEIAQHAAGFSPLLIRPDALIWYWPGLRSLIPEIGSGFALSDGGGVTEFADHPPVIYPDEAAVGLVGSLSADITASITATGVFSGQLSAGDDISADISAGATVAATISCLANTSAAVTANAVLAGTLIGYASVILEPDDDDGDISNAATTTLTGADTLTPTLTLAGPNYGTNDGFSGWVNVKRCITIPAGPDRDVTVNLDLNDKQTPGDPAGNGNTTGPWVGVCARDKSLSGTIAGLDAWAVGTGYSHNPTTQITTSTLTLQGGKTYEIAMKPTFPVRDWQAIVTWALANGASPVAADTNGDGTYAMVTPLFRKNTVTLADVPMMAFKIGTGPRRRIVDMGQHAGEHVSTAFGWRTLVYLLGGSPQADKILADWTIIFEFANPSGTKYGCIRNEATSNSPNGDDMNRQWLDADTSSPQVQAIRAMLDAEGWTDAFDMLVTYHGDQNVNVTKPYELYYNTDIPAELALFNKLDTAFGSANWTPIGAAYDSGGETMGTWGNRHGAALSITWELADARTGFPSLADQWDAAVLQLETSLNELTDEGYFGTIISADLSASASIGAAAATYGNVGAAVAASAAMDGVISARANLSAGISAAALLSGMIEGDADSMAAAVSVSAAFAGTVAAFGNIAAGMDAQTSSAANASAFGNLTLSISGQGQVASIGAAYGNVVAAIASSALVSGMLTAFGSDPPAPHADRTLNVRSGDRTLRIMARG